jgi:hypothetical protein
MHTERLTLPLALLIVLAIGSHCSFAPDSTPVMNTPTPLSGWNQYRNDTFHFQFNYPPGSHLVETPDHKNLVMDLPLAATQNIYGKTLLVNAAMDQAVCASPIARADALAPGQFAGDQVSISGTSFLKQEGGTGGSNATYWISYSAVKEFTCVTISFVMKYSRLYPYPTPEPTIAFEDVAEVIRQVLATFAWRN